MKTRHLALALCLGFTAVTAAAQPSPSSMEPEAVQALDRMRAYFGTFTAFQINADTSLDLVLDNGQKVQSTGSPPTSFGGRTAS